MTTSRYITETQLLHLFHTFWSQKSNQIVIKNHLLLHEYLLLTVVSAVRFRPGCPMDSSASFRTASTGPASNGRSNRWHIGTLFRHGAAFAVARRTSCVCFPARAADCVAERRTLTFYVVSFVVGFVVAGAVPRGGSGGFG